MQPRGIWSAGQGDDKERFLADLRALRDKAALGYEELAERAHYPTDVLKEAEDGPSLPGLPILAAYVRACGADVPDWEERWRCLGFEAHPDPGLPVRPAGASPAAVAGARAGITVAPPEAYDPERIRAALRGHHGQAEQAVRGTAHQETAAAGLGGINPDAAAGGSQIPQTRQGPAGWNAVAGWDDTVQRDSGRSSGGGPQPEPGASWGTAAGQGGPSGGANGHHHSGPRSAGLFDGAAVPAPDYAGSPEGIRHDPFSAAWLQDSELTSPPPTPRNAWFAPQEGADGTQAWRPAEGGVARPEPADGGPAPRQDEGGPASPAPTDFWTPSAAATTPADVQRPGPASPAAEEQRVPPSSWPPPPEISSTPVPGLAHRTAPELTHRAAPDLRPGAVSAVPAQTPAGPAVPRPAPAPPSESRRDRLFPVRLLVVIVAAALIGSILVMVLK